MFSIPIFDYISSGDYISAFAYILGCVVIVFLVLPFHEYAHGWMANKLGDPTARYSGRLSLNPMRHIDWIGAAAIMLVGFGWAKPVPVNARNFKNPKWGMAVTALAGPVSNLLMALVALLLNHGLTTLALSAGLFAQSGTMSMVILFLLMFFRTVAEINVCLAVFNLIPIPPLDGSRLLTALLPDGMYYKIMQYEQFIMIGLFVLLFTGILSTPLSIMSNVVYAGLNWLTELPFALI